MKNDKATPPSDKTVEDVPSKRPKKEQQTTKSHTPISTVPPVPDPISSTSLPLLSLDSMRMYSNLLSMSQSSPPPNLSNMPSFHLGSTQFFNPNLIPPTGPVTNLRTGLPTQFFNPNLMPPTGPVTNPRTSLPT